MATTAKDMWAKPDAANLFTTLFRQWQHCQLLLKGGPVAEVSGILQYHTKVEGFLQDLVDEECELLENRVKESEKKAKEGLCEEWRDSVGASATVPQLRDAAKMSLLSPGKGKALKEMWDELTKASV